MDEKQKSVLLTEQGYEDAEDVLEVWVALGSVWLRILSPSGSAQGDQYYAGSRDIGMDFLVLHKRLTSEFDYPLFSPKLLTGSMPMTSAGVQTQDWYDPREQ